MPLLKFILLGLLSAFIFLAFALIFSWGRWISPSIETANSLLLFLPAAAGRIILPSVTSGLLFTYFSYRNNRMNPAAVILTAGAAFAVLFFGYRFTAAMTYNQDAVAFQPFNERKLHSTDTGIIYTDRIDAEDSSAIDGIIVRKTDSDLPGFKYYEEGRLTGGAEPALNLGDGRTIDVRPSNPVFNSTFSAESLLSGFTADIELLNIVMKKSAVSDEIQYLVLTAVLTSFLMACLLFRGATVWPLLDFMIILALHRLVFYLFAFVSNETDFISETLFGGTAPGNIPMLSLAACTVLIVLFGMLSKALGPNARSRRTA